MFALYALARFDEVERLSREVLSSTEEPEPAFPAFLAMARAATGDTAAARAELARMVERETPPLLVGLMHAALGETDAAFAALREVPAWTVGAVLMLRCWFPRAFGPLREDPRFEELLRDVYRNWRLQPPPGSDAGGSGCPDQIPLVPLGADA